MALSFAFDANKETPEDVKRRRALADAILGRQRAPQNVGEGWGAIANGIVANVQGRRANAAQQAGQESASAAFNPILDAFNAKMTGGFPAAPNPGGSSSMATMPATDTASARVAQAHGGGAQRAGEWLQYANQGATRSLPLNDRLVQAMSFLPELGVTMKVVSGGQVGKGEKGGRVGSTRHDHGNAADVDFFMGERKLTPQNEQDRAILSQIVQRGKAAGVTGWGEGDDYMGSGRVHLGFGSPGTWGAGGRGANTPEWLKNAYNTPYQPLATGAVAANEAMASGQLAGSSALAPEALQQWAFQNYAPDAQNGAMDAVNALGASQPIGVAENPQDILAQEQAMMGQDPLAFQQPDMMMPSQGTQPRLQAPMAAAQQPMPQPMPQAAPPLPDPRMVDDMPVAGIQPQQLAQAGGFPEMAGGNPQAIPAPGPDIGMLLQAASNPWLSEQQRGIVNMMLEQQMQAQDPMRQLDMDYKRAQIGKLQADASGLGDAAKVQSSVVLDDGSTVMVMNNGQRRVLSPTGDEVTGQAAADAIRSAREYTVQNQQDIYSGRRSGTLGADIELGGAAKAAEDIGAASVKAGMDAWGDYGKLQSSLGNINEAISAIDNGAKSGLVYNMLPNVTEASASLQNAMNRMGLDVIGSVTFGALSEGEMRLAMETAVPRGLQSAELRSWLIRKRDAQEKAAGMLADAAQFLTVPGNTINDWIAKNRANPGSSGAAAPRQPVSIGGYTIEQVD